MMPFGAGRRICPGLNVATLHLEYFVANMVRAFEWHAADGEEVDVDGEKASSWPTRSARGSLPERWL
jgi:cytochrome P450